MSNILTTLTDVAVTVFRARTDKSLLSDIFRDTDPVLAETQERSFLYQIPDERFAPLVDVIFSEPELAPLRPSQGELDPMILHPGGGQRTNLLGIVRSLFGSAYMHMY